MNEAMGSGIKIFVNEDDAERAFQIIKGGDRSVHCPKCNSLNVKQTISKNWYQKAGVLLLALITANPIGDIRSSYSCNDCGKKFVI
jgi:DNA-directed RNA polymerase subunit RPC12/RpoP